MSDLKINHPTGPEPPDAEPRWTTAELQEEFEVRGFLAPFVTVRRKSDGVRGTLRFVQNPGRERVYYDFVSDSGDQPS